MHRNNFKIKNYIFLTSSIVNFAVKINSTLKQSNTSLFLSQCYHTTFKIITFTLHIVPFFFKLHYLIGHVRWHLLDYLKWFNKFFVLKNTVNFDFSP